MIGYYNELHNTTLLKYDLLSNYSLTEAVEQLNTTNSTQDTTGTSSTSSDSNSKGSEYPQQPIAGGNFLSDETVTTVESEVNDTTKSVGSSTEEQTYQKKIEGLTGTTYPELIQKHRDSLIRIKQMVIEELKPCFILVH